MTLETATITSKRQLTIPATIFKRMGLLEGQKVVVFEEEGMLRIESARALLDRLDGCVKVPVRFKNLPIDKIIKKAKEEYFKKCYDFR